MRRNVLCRECKGDSSRPDRVGHIAIDIVLACRHIPGRWNAGLGDFEKARDEMLSERLP